MDCLTSFNKDYGFKLEAEDLDQDSQFYLNNSHYAQFQIMT